MAVDEEDAITLQSAYVITGVRTRGLPAARKACQQQVKHSSSKQSMASAGKARQQQVKHEACQQELHASSKSSASKRAPASLPSFALCIHVLENVGRNQGSEELALVLRRKHVDLQSSLHVSSYLRAYATHALKEQVDNLQRSILLLLLFLKQVALDAVLNSAHENNNHRETSGESGAA